MPSKMRIHVRSDSSSLIPSVRLTPRLLQSWEHGSRPMDELRENAPADTACRIDLSFAVDSGQMNSGISSDTPASRPSCICSHRPPRAPSGPASFNERRVPHVCATFADMGFRKSSPAPGALITAALQIPLIGRTSPLRERKAKTGGNRRRYVQQSTIRDRRTEARFPKRFMPRSSSPKISGLFLLLSQRIQ